MTEAETLEVLQFLIGAFPGREVTGYNTLAYHAALSEYSKATVMQTAKEMLRMPLKYVPTAGEIAEACSRSQRRIMFATPVKALEEPEITPDEAREIMRRTYETRPDAVKVLGLGEVLETDKKEKVA